MSACHTLRSLEVCQNPGRCPTQPSAAVTLETTLKRQTELEINSSQSRQPEPARQRIPPQLSRCKLSCCYLPAATTFSAGMR